MGRPGKQAIGEPVVARRNRPAPVLFRGRPASGAADELGPFREIYFRDHPEQALRRHHAGVDAEALCWAFAKVARGSMREG